ncbi:MAG: hypothetical protein Q4B85_02160 [Lachnospiraceae bacterium]|nr:hypothetical protein [Lachnospiraceae bacterium]
MLFQNNKSKIPRIAGFLCVLLFCYSFCSGCGNNSTSTNTPKTATTLTDVISTPDNIEWTEQLLDPASYGDLLDKKLHVPREYALTVSQELFDGLEKDTSVVALTAMVYPENCSSYDTGIEYGCFAIKSSDSGYMEAWNPWALFMGPEGIRYCSGGLSAVTNNGYLLFNADGNLEAPVLNGKVMEGEMDVVTLLDMGFPVTKTEKPIPGLIKFYRIKVSFADTLETS